MTLRDADRAGGGGSPPQTTTPDTIGKEAPDDKHGSIHHNWLLRWPF